MQYARDQRATDNRKRRHRDKVQDDLYTLERNIHDLRASISKQNVGDPSNLKTFHGQRFQVD